MDGTPRSSSRWSPGDDADAGDPSGDPVAGRAHRPPTSSAGSPRSARRHHRRARRPAHRHHHLPVGAVRHEGRPDLPPRRTPKPWPPRTFTPICAALPASSREGGIGARTLKPIRLLTGLQSRTATTSVEVTPVAAVSVRVHRHPPGTTPHPAMLWIHGGGMVMGTAAQDDAICPSFLRGARDHGGRRRLSARTGTSLSGPP